MWRLFTVARWFGRLAEWLDRTELNLYRAEYRNDGQDR